MTKSIGNKPEDGENNSLIHGKCSQVIYLLILQPMLVLKVLVEAVEWEVTILFVFFKFLIDRY